MKPEPSDEELEQWLRTHAKATVPDDGFTHTVLSRLPAKKAARSLTWKQIAPVVAILSTLISLLYPFLDTLEALNRTLAENPAAAVGDTVRIAGWLCAAASLVVVALALKPLSFVWKGSLGAWHQFTSAFRA